MNSIIDISKLPSLPQTLIELIDMCNGTDRNLKEIGSLIARDASISARILQLANSAFIGARNKFTDIEHAVVYLGVDTIRNLAISVSVNETFRNVHTSGVLNIDSFWYHSYLSAVLSKAFAEVVGYADPAEAYLTGLLHDLGKLLLFISFPDKYPALIEQESSGNMLPVFERGTLGVTHAEASSLLVSQWNLAQSVTDAVYAHHDEEESVQALDNLARILYCANRLSNTLVLDPDNPDSSSQRLLDLSSDELSEIITRSKEEVDQITTEMGIKVTSTPMTAAAVSKKSQANRVDLAKKVQAVSTIGGAVDNLLKAKNLNRVVRIIEESFHILFNIRYCLLILPDIESENMYIHVSTSNQHHGHDELHIPVALGPSGMLADCLLSDTIMHATPVEKFAIEDTEVQCMRLLDSEGLIAIPVPLEAEKKGILVAGVGEVESTSILAQQDTLTMLAGQIGMRIKLERVQKKASSDQVAAISQMARQVALEISTPVTRLEKHLMVLETLLKAHPEAHKELLALMGEVERISSITDQLNDLSGGAIAGGNQPIDINVVMGEIIDFYDQSLPDSSQLRMNLEIDPDCPSIVTNEAAVRKIIGNLLSNSIAALGTSGNLKVKTEFKTQEEGGDSTIRLIIEDDRDHKKFSGEAGGEGSEVDQIAILPAHSSLATAISRKLVHEIGGTISYSAGQQPGTRFTISLPVEKPAEA